MTKQPKAVRAWAIVDESNNIVIQSIVSRAFPPIAMPNSKDRAIPVLITPVPAKRRRSKR